MGQHHGKFGAGKVSTGRKVPSGRTSVSVPTQASLLVAARTARHQQGSKPACLEAAGGGQKRAQAPGAGAAPPQHGDQQLHLLHE